MKADADHLLSEEDGFRAPRRTVVYTHGGGRLGNQLLRFAHLLAWAIENQPAVRLINLSFVPYAQGWEEWERHPGCSYPEPITRLDFWARLFLRLPAFLRARLDWRIQRAIHRWADRANRTQSIVAEEDFEGGEIQLGSSGFTKRMNVCELTYLAGWRIADWALVRKHESAIRALMRPSPSILIKARRTVEWLRSRADFLVALHIRRGDYRDFDGGRFFYDLAQYRDWIGQIAALELNSSIGLLVCGDEKLDEHLLADLRCPWILSEGSVNCGGLPVTSLVEMSMTDLIVGPPSTFSVYAAFLGRVRMLPLEVPGQKLNLNQLVDGHLFAAREHPSLSKVVR
jgi:hypothetical protein